MNQEWSYPTPTPPKKDVIPVVTAHKVRGRLTFAQNRRTFAALGTKGLVSYV
ncbi:hypothetical protein [Pontibacter actiniarum]|uniref:hypothetical protein n=1 Tax=Pontibacter actiniarum TaxID=323450 RepID=UPI0012FB67EE|nr:hypothetical protein [Pontibacter actiniarum]